MTRTLLRHDPALTAAERALAAELNFLAIPSNTARDEAHNAFVAAEEAWEAADEGFADAVPHSAAGAIAKLKAVAEMLRATPVDEDSLEMRHVQSLLCYLEGLDPSG